MRLTRIVIGFNFDANNVLESCSREDAVYCSLSRIHFRDSKVHGILAFIERLRMSMDDTDALPLSTGYFNLWISIPPKENTPTNYSFVGKRSVFASKDFPAAPLTVQIDVPVIEKLGTKRLEPIKTNSAVAVQVMITGMSRSCICGELLEYALTDKLARPNSKAPCTPRKQRPPLLEPGDDGAAASPSKRQKK